MKSSGKGNESTSTDLKILYSEHTTSRKFYLNCMENKSNSSMNTNHNLEDGIDCIE